MQLELVDMDSKKLYETIKYTPKKPFGYVRRKTRRALSGFDIICSCAGWGKSGYLYQLYEEEKPAVYISLGAEDNCISRFDALINSALPDSLRGDDTLPVLELVGHISANGGVILIDNADMITDPAVGSVLAMLAVAASEGHIRIVFAVRTIPEFLMPYVIEGRAELIGIDELRFDKEMIRELAFAYNEELTDRYLYSLEKISGGWPIAATAILAGECEDPEKAIEQTFLARYAQQNILCSMSRELLDYARRTAFLTAENDEITGNVLGLTDTGFLLSELINDGYVGKGAYPVYPEALRRILCTGLPEELKKRLTENASDFYIRSKRFAQAVHLFDESGNAEGAERLLRLYGDRLLANFEFELIGCCGRIIMEKGRITSPDALGAMAQYYYYSGDHDKMEQAYNMADSMFGKENKFSIYRRLYKGLLRYDSNPELYRRNVTTALDYLRENSIPLPFLYQKELDVLNSMAEEKLQGEHVLTVNRFGGLRLFAGEPQTEIQCKTKRSAELIVYLMETGGRPVSREELLSVFWPEDMPANAVAMLHNMIYHLRRELAPYGIENIISYKNKCYSLDMTMLKDADSRISEICTALEKGNKELALKKCESGCSYWGSYLGSTDIPWANEKREYYDRCYTDLCMLMAEHYRSCGQPDKELEVLKNAFRLEPYSEQLMYDILGCFKTLGKPDKARQYYEDYSAKLDAEFGTRPSNWLRKRFFSCFSDNDHDGGAEQG